jgi:hypothetical protein
MTQTISRKSLYEQDFVLWLDIAIAQLRSGDLHNLDTENLIEELEGLANKDRREISTRLKRLIEHILKRCYVNMPECHRGWEVTIVNQRDELNQLLKQSPSLKRHFLETFDDSFTTALKMVRIKYPETSFPAKWQFNRDIDAILSIDFWE